jgi:rare lipoprotein A
MIVSWDTLKMEGWVIGGNVGDAVTMRKVMIRSMMLDGTRHIVDVTSLKFFEPIADKKIESNDFFICKASYYHDALHGNRTANGDIYDKSKMTAAHKGLPFGTKLLVTNTINSDTVTVEINDRGPFVKGRELDLSRAAAEKLGMISNGVVKVKCEIINE